MKKFNLKKISVFLTTHNLNPLLYIVLMLNNYGFNIKKQKYFPYIFYFNKKKVTFVYDIIKI